MLQLACAEDRAFVESLAQQVHAAHVSWRPDLYEMAECLYPVQRFQEAVKLRQLYVAKLNGVPVGYILLKFRQCEAPGIVKHKAMVVEELCVEEEFRGHGIGTAMMDDAKALAKAFGCRDLRLGVYPQNDGAVAFYQKCGLMIRSIEMQMSV